MPSSSVWQGRVPVRIDLAGGTLDIWPVHLTLPEPGVTVNAAVDLPATATVWRLEGGRVELESRDRKERVVYDSPEALRASLHEGGGPARLLARAVEAVAPKGGIHLETNAMAPAGAGLGGSSALLGCVLATLVQAVGNFPGRSRALGPTFTDTGLESVRRLAQDLETWVIGAPTGYQDYYPPLFGGCLALEGRPGGVVVERLPVDLAALSRRLRLVYTGAPHHSGMTNWGALRAWFDQEPTTVAALKEIASIARALRDALRKGDLDAALPLVVEEGRVRRRMAPGITTPAIEALDAAVRREGALGTKPMGAGGGGCVLVVLRDEQEPAGLARALASAGGTSIPCTLVEQGFSLLTRTQTLRSPA